MSVITLVIGCLAAASLAAQTPAGPSTGLTGQAGRGGCGGGDSGVERLRAFDPAAVERGRTVFGGLAANPNAPITFMLDGRQFVVVGAGDSLCIYAGPVTRGAQHSERVAKCSADLEVCPDRQA